MSRNCIFSRRAQPCVGQEAESEKPKISSAAIRQIFSDCDDFETRTVAVGGSGGLKVTVCWLDGVVSGREISDDVIRPLACGGDRAPCASEDACIAALLSGAVWSYSAKCRRALSATVQDILRGSCAVLFDGAGAAVTFEVKTSNVRSIGEPKLEKSVKGAKDAFVETLRINTSLVRRKLRSPELKIVNTTVGQRSGTRVAVLYMESIANDALVRSVRSRIDAIDVDSLITAGNLEQTITDAPRSPFPQLIHTERPDKFASELLSGRVGILVDGLPIGFLAPAALAQFMRVGEDSAQFFAAASLLTILRWLSLIAAVTLPALLVAISMYHPEMLPYKLMLSMIRAKQEVPFSVGVEIVGMLLAFELLQEAGVRLPDPVGDTVSIIGALIVGQAAVDARVVSPVAVIVVAAAGICGFTQPSQDLGSAVRLLRLLAVLAAIALGMYGIVLLLALIVLHLCSLDSFGVSYTAPMSEGGFLSALRAFVQLPLSWDKYRPAALKTKDRRKQK